MLSLTTHHTHGNRADPVRIALKPCDCVAVPRRVTPAVRAEPVALDAPPRLARDPRTPLAKAREAHTLHEIAA